MPSRLTPQKFIQRAKEIHKEDNYDYSEIKYVHSQEKIPIICKIHGKYFQSPQKHLSGQGCPKCRFEKSASKQRTPVNKFIEKAISIHGDKYKYDKVIYKNNSTKVIITCSIHGDFEMTPGNHTHKTTPQGCPECGGRTNWNKEKFINEAKKNHADRYSYFKIKFNTINDPVIIICREHGDFTQKPSKHLAGQGCPVCSGTKKKTTDQFIEEARKIHGDKYNYDKVEYVTTHKKIIITCPIHCDFEMAPANHTHKTKPQGCPRCSGKKVFNTDDFVSIASGVHDNLYDYSLTKYINSTTPVEIICPYHGVFKQKPQVHLLGSGCTKCRNPKGENKIEEYLKKHNINYQNQYSFPDCKYKNPLFFDFMICINNRMALIEYNGQQHYEELSFNSNKKSRNFIEIQKRDKIKNDYCKKNNIPFLIIGYYDYLTIDEILKEFIFKI